MKYSNPKRWKDEPAFDGMLFFAQRLEEMLFHYTEDVFRAPFHNTYTLINEYLSVLNEVILKRTNISNLKYIYEELTSSFNADPVIEYGMGKEYKVALNEKLNSCPKQEQNKLIKYINGKIKQDKYLEWSIDYLVNKIKENHKSEIELGLRCWLPHVINQLGYKSTFIYSYCKHVFFNSEVKSFDAISSFLEKFKGKKDNYRVYFKFSNQMGMHREILEKRIKLISKDDGNFSRLKSKSNYWGAYLEIEAVDCYSAALYGFEKINIFLKFYKFLSNQNKRIIFPTVMIYNDNFMQFEFENIGKSKYFLIEWIDYKNIEKVIDACIISMQKSDKITYHRIQKCINLHNRALQNVDLSDGFLNLWSTLEVLCNDDLLDIPQEHLDDSNRRNFKVDVVIDKIINILQNDYLTVVFDDLQQSLIDNLGEDFYLGFSSQAKVNFNKEQMDIAKFCLLCEDDNLFEEFFRNKLTGYPIIRNKLYKLLELRKHKNELLQTNSVFTTKSFEE